MMKRLKLLPAIAILLLATQTSAQAQMITFDPTSYAKLVTSSIQSAWASVTNSVGQIASSLISIQNTNSLLTGARTETHVRTAEDITRAYYLDKTYNACSHMQASMAAAYQVKNGQQLRMALARGGTGCTATGANNATNIKTRMTLGLAPCSAASSTKKTDPDLASYQNFKCQQQWGGRWEGADQTMESIFSNFQLLVPPNFVLPINGVCQPLQAPTDEKYMPFIAAYSYCNSINPQVPPPLAPTGTVTSSDLSVDARARARADMSAAYSVCISLLEERMQYDSTQTVQAFQQLHDSQNSACTGDASRNWYDNSSGTCSSSGRSSLERRFDLAYRNAQRPYIEVYKKGIETQNLYNEDRELEKGQEEFEAHIEEEREHLTNAINAARMAKGIGASPDSMPVGHQ